MHKQPLLIMLLCFLAGILVADRGWMQVPMPYLAAGLGLVLVGLGFLKNYWLQKFRPVFLGVFFFGVGAFTMHLHSLPPKVHKFKGRQTYIFNLKKKLNSSEKYRRYEVEIIGVKTLGNAAAPAPPRQAPLLPPFKAVISINKDLPQLDFRHHYQADAYLNPVEAPDNDFQFNYAEYLSRKKIHHQASINKQPLSAKKYTLTFSDKIRQQRLELLARIDQCALESKTREFLKGIILADRTEMDAGTVADFNRSGLVHLLAISGSHMVIIFGIILFLVKSSFPLRFRRSAIVIALVAIWSFAIFIDYGSSVVRSCIMITSFYLYVLMQRKPDFLHAMSLAAFVILVVDPHQLMDIGFQLSFIAVLGIFWLNQPLLSYFGNLTSKPKRFFANIFSVSLSAQLATLPLVIYYFHQYSALSIAANLVVIPFSEIIIVFSLLITLLLAFNLEFNWLNSLFDQIVKNLLQIINWFAEKDFAFFENVSMSVGETVLLIVALYLWRNLLVRKNYISVVHFTGAVLLFFALRLGMDIYHFKSNETMLVNYYKDKILIVKSGATATFYVESNSDFKKVQKYTVMPYVASRRISNVKIEKIPPGTSAIEVRGRSYAID